MTNVKIDADLALQGEVGLFYYNQDNLASVPTFEGIYGVALPDTLSVNFGELSALNVPSTTKPNTFVTARMIRSAPDLGEFTITEYIKRGVKSNLERISQVLCQHAFLIPLDGCTRPDDINSWDSILLVLGANISKLEYSSLRQRDGNDPLETSGTFSLIAAARILPTQLGEKADASVLTQVVDVIFADEASCGTCSSYSSGCQAYYALVDEYPSSPGLPSRIVGTLDNSTFNDTIITTLGVQQGDGLAAVGKYLVVVSSSDEALHYIEKDNVFTDAWTRVSTGFVAAAGPMAIHAESTSEVYMVGLGGYIYKSDDITSGVSVVEDGSLSSEDGNAIHGQGQVIVSVHNNNVVKMTTNGGTAWSLITGPSVGNNLVSVAVISQTQFYVGTDAGELFYTMDSGSTWTQRNLPNQSNITKINDIVFSPDFSEIGWLAVQTATTGEIYRSLTGGRSWYRTTPGITQLSTAPQQYNAVAACGTDYVVTGGLKTGGVDGILAFGA